MHQTEKCGLTMSRNFSKGARIISLDEFVTQEFVYVRDRLYHSGFVNSWQIRLVNNLIKQGCVYHATRLSDIDEVIQNLYRREGLNGD